MSCVVCGDPSPRPRLRVGEVEILVCSRCGLRWWEPPEGFRPDALYAEEYFTGAEVQQGYDDYANLESGLRHTFARRLSLLGRPAPGARLLDVGAAFGYAVDEAGRAGWQATGLEVSAAAARTAARVAGGRLAVGSALATPFRDASLDVVTLWDVLEHLADPQAAASEIARLLKPGGRLVLTTGDVGSLVARLSGARWHLYTLPEHLFFFTRESLRRLLEAHGLRVVRMDAEGASYPVAYLVERLAKSLFRRRAPRAGRWPGAGLHVPCNLFDIVTVEAVREGAG